jgi:hypothetical protein
MLICGLLLTAGVSFAQVTGTVWENTPDASNAGDPANLASSLPHANFTSAGINYCSDHGIPGCSSIVGYTVSAFLGNPTFTSPANGFNASGNLDNIEVQLTGVIALNAGSTSFVIGHDDGLTLQITGGPGTANCSTQSGALCVSTPGPTGFAGTPFTITASVAGNYSFTLDYAECCGPPGYLQFAYANGDPIGSSTPEPSGFALFGTALAGTFWLMRRRKHA